MLDKHRVSEVVCVCLTNGFLRNQPENVQDVAIIRVHLMVNPIEARAILIYLVLHSWKVGSDDRFKALHRCR